MTPFTLETWTIRNKYGRFQLKRYANQYGTFFDIEDLSRLMRHLDVYGVSAEDCMVKWIEAFAK